MDERLLFVARLLDGEKMALTCREFGISRKTGYKIFAGIRSSVSEGWRITPRVPIGTPISSHFRSRRQFFGSSKST
jgi:hypothetical protein